MPIASVEGKVEVLAGIADLTGVQRFVAYPECATNHRHRGVAGRRPCRRIAAMRMLAVSTRRTMARPSWGSMQAATGETPNVPMRRAIPAAPTRTLPTRCRTSDHCAPATGRCTAASSQRSSGRPVRRQPRAAVCGSAPSRRRGRGRQTAGIGDEPAVERRQRRPHTTPGTVMLLVGQPQHDASVRRRAWRRDRGATGPRSVGPLGGQQRGQRPDRDGPGALGVSLRQP